MTPSITQVPTSRSRRPKRPVVIAAIVLAGALLIVFILATSMQRYDTTPLGANSPGSQGAHAAAEILRNEGVDITTDPTPDTVERRAGPGTTILITDAADLTDEMWTRLDSSGSDVVVVFQNRSVNNPLGLGYRSTSYQRGVPANCQAPHAQAAQTISEVSWVLHDGQPGTEYCFGDGDSSGAYLNWSTSGGGEAHVVAEDRPLTNDALAEAGNAALVLGVLGGNDDLVWYEGREGAGWGDIPLAGVFTDSTPPALLFTLLLGGCTVAVLAYARMRRLGPLIVEDLPVIVKSSESTRGRGALYRRSGARGHSAAGLRAGTATRLARRLGLPRSAGGHELADVVARATSWPREDVVAVLYGAPPSTDRDLVALSAQLTALEDEVHQR